MYSLLVLRRTRSIVKIIERETAALITTGIDHMLLLACVETLGGFGAGTGGLQPIPCSWSKWSGAIFPSISM